MADTMRKAFGCADERVQLTGRSARGRTVGGRASSMRKAHRHMPDLPQAVADRGTEVIERHLAAYGVTRARDLPEEGKVYLRRELIQFFNAELPEGLPHPAASRRWQSWWGQLTGRFRRH